MRLDVTGDAEPAPTGVTKHTDPATGVPPWSSAPLRVMPAITANVIRQCGKAGSLVVMPWCCWLLIHVLDQLRDPGYSFLLHGMLDAIPHLATGAIVLLAARPLWARRTGLWLLAGSIVIDIDHFPVWRDWIEHFDTRSRGILHTPLAVGVIVVLALMLPRQRRVLMAVAIGAASHLFRDLGTGTVQLTWPLFEGFWTIPHQAYMLVLAGLCGVSTVHGLRLVSTRKRDT